MGTEEMDRGRPSVALLANCTGVTKASDRSTVASPTPGQLVNSVSGKSFISAMTLMAPGLAHCVWLTKGVSAGACVGSERSTEKMLVVAPAAPSHVIHSIWLLSSQARARGRHTLAGKVRRITGS